MALVFASGRQVADVVHDDQVVAVFGFNHRTGHEPAARVGAAFGCRRQRQRRRRRRGGAVVGDAPPADGVMIDVDLLFDAD